MNPQTPLPEYNPHRLAAQIAGVKEMLRSGAYTDEQAQAEIERLRAADDELRARFIEAGYKKFNIPQMMQEATQMHAREQRQQAAKSGRWLYSWNLEPATDPFDYSGLLGWEDDAEKVRAESRKQAVSNAAPVEAFVSRKMDWLWPGRLPLGKVSLLTGNINEGKSLVVCDLIARVTTGRDWPDGSPGGEPADVLLIAPDTRLTEVVFPRLEAAGADLLRVHALSWIDWKDRKSGEPDGDAFRLPVDGPLLEHTLEENPSFRLIVIDPLAEFLVLPESPGLRETALHDVLEDFEDLAHQHELTFLCVETARPGGMIGTAAGDQWRAHYDSTFMTVWGVARDPRDCGRRLLLPILHALGDDRTGFQFTIEQCDLGTSRIAWGQQDDSVTYAEATGRVRLGRGIWSFSQTADAEAWLRKYLKQGEKPSVEIFSDARELGFTEHPLRTALRRVASKFKQGREGGWFWRLKENG